MTIVIDASVAALWFMPQADSEKARAWLTSDHELIAPDLIYLEVGNVLVRAVRRGEADAARVDEVQNRVLPSLVRLLPSGEHARAAFEIACSFGGSTYDGLYLAVARALDAAVVTNDAEMLKVARRADIKAVPLAGAKRP